MDYKTVSAKRDWETTREERSWLQGYHCGYACAPGAENASDHYAWQAGYVAGRNERNAHRRAGERASVLVRMKLHERLARG